MFTIDSVLQTYVDKKIMKEERNKGVRLNTVERENVIEIEHAIFLNADLHWQADNPDFDNFKAGYEFAQKSNGKQVHAIKWDDWSSSGEAEELLVFLGTLDEIMKRIDSIPNVSKVKRTLLNDRYITKTICKRCHLERSQKFPYDGETEDPATVEINMENKWETEHKIFCFSAGIWGDDLEIHSSPPTDCPYYMEHLTCAEVKDSSENDTNKPV